MKNYLKKLTGVSKVNALITSEFDKIKVLSAKAIVNQIKEKKGQLNNIQDAEFSVFSQWGDDGIIQYLINTIAIKNKTFVEFGVENYREANTRFLLINNNWDGLVIDGSEANINFIKNDPISWNYNLNSIASFITKDNINQLIEGAGFKGEIGLLHIDVDGNDYWFWECLNVINPEIVIMEYNSLFGGEFAITVPYKEDFFVTHEHYSNLYFGASISALTQLAKTKGYSLIGSNSNGNNAYFVRNDKMSELRSLVPAEAYVKSKFKQNRDIDGNLTLEKDIQMIKKCGHLPVIDVITNQQNKLEIYL